MPVNGLPSILENVLNSCLQEKAITEWKVEGIAYNIQVLISFDQQASQKNSFYSSCLKDLERHTFDLSNSGVDTFQSYKSIENPCSEDVHWKIEGLKDSLIKHENGSVLKIHLEEEGKKSDLLLDDNDNNILDSIPAKYVDNDNKSVLNKELSPLSNFDILSLSSSINANIDHCEDIIQVTEPAKVAVYNKTYSPCGSPRDDITTKSNNQKNTRLSPSTYRESTDSHAIDKQWSTINNCDSIKSSADTSPTFYQKKPFYFNKNQESTVQKHDNQSNKDSSNILSKVIKVLKKTSTHCVECSKVIKQTTKSKCTVCDVFICSDCIYNGRHLPDHKRYISMFSCPTDANENYCRACGYVSRIKHTYNTNFTCDVCPEYLLCQGCMSQGMHSHHEDYLRPVLQNKT